MLLKGYSYKKIFLACRFEKNNILGHSVRQSGSLNPFLHINLEHLSYLLGVIEIYILEYPIQALPDRTPNNL
jgi:hypothetical protein